MVLSSFIKSVCGKAGIQKLWKHVCVTKLSVRHLEKRKPSDLGAWWCQGLSLVVGMCFLFFKHCGKTAPSSKSSEHAGVGLQIPRHPSSSACYLTRITKKLERCASVILKLTRGLKENICLECGLNEVWCYLWNQRPKHLEVSMWAALVPNAFPWQWTGRGKPGKEQKAGQGGLVGLLGGLASRVHGTTAAFRATSGSGDTRTAPVHYSFTKLPLSSWSWTEVLPAHWKHSPNSPTGVTELFTISLFPLNAFHYNITFPRPLNPWR